MKKIKDKFFIILAVMLSSISIYAKSPKNVYGRDVDALNGIVAAAKPEASKIGVEILKNGGNAIDAAVATAFSIGVLEPNASGIGGGGFMLIKPANEEGLVIDFREVAPKRATPNMFEVDKEGKPVNRREIQVGGKSIAVPGEVAGLLAALRIYGTMSREEVLAPAIKLAREGIIVTEGLSNIMMSKLDVISEFEETEKLYLNDGLPYMDGEILKNEDLAKTLEKISKKGEAAFYEGEIAEAISKAVQKEGGLITKEDLKNYRVKLRKPVEGTYRGYKIISVPPASSGGVHVIELLNMMENFNLRKIGNNTPEAWHIWSEAMRQMFADRAEYMGDTDFVKVPIKGLTSKDYAKDLVGKFDLKKPSFNKKSGEPWKHESESTTHISVMDKQGNMVTITQTINHFFGSGVVVPGTGILLNDQMDDFVAEAGHKNSIKGGKRPLSSMTPTAVLTPEGKSYLAIGTPGATRIITTVAQVISNIIDYGMNIQEAINAPKIIQYQNGPLKVEGRVSLNSYDKLKKMGHDIQIKKDYDLYFGGVQGVMYNYEKNRLEGGADPRRDGQAVGF